MALLSDVSLDDIREWILCHLASVPTAPSYPRGLVAEQIPARRARQPAGDRGVHSDEVRKDDLHRPGRDHQDACLELSRCAGNQFDTATYMRSCSASQRRYPQLARAAA